MSRLGVDNIDLILALVFISRYVVSNHHLFYYLNNSLHCAETQSVVGTKCTT